MTAETKTGDSWFVVDAPLNDASLDAFGHADIADNLHRMVTEPSPHRRMIGLFGEFGVGKSSIIELLQGKLKGHPELRVIRMSAERHEPVGFHRAAVYGFAEALVAADEISQKQAEEILEPLRSAQTRTLTDAALSPIGQLLSTIQKRLKLSWKRFLLFIGLTVVGAAVLLGLTAWLVPADWWANVQAFIVPLLTTTAFFTPFVWLGRQITQSTFDPASLFTPGTRVSQRPKVEAADEQERAFAELALKAKHRLVVAVDDIDRLSQQQILDALNAIRSFQLTCKRDTQPIFIISIAEEIIRQALSVEGEVQPAHSQDFLNRLFTLRQEVPVHETPDLRDFARSLLTAQAPALASKLKSDLEDVIIMLVHDDVSDPRHVVRLINAFSSDYRLALARESRTGVRALQKKAVTTAPAVLARVVVMKTDYPSFFAAALNDLALVDAASNASVVGANVSGALTKAGFDPDEDAHGSLFKYLSRTRDWVPQDVDLVPFFYLGQDRYSQTLGNALARDVRSALANNQSAELAKLADAASESGSADTFVELVASAFRALNEPERRNAAAAVAVAATVNTTLRTSSLARAVASTANSLVDDPQITVGLLELARHASPIDARTLATAATAVADPAVDEVLWGGRALLEGVLGEKTFEAWATSRISDVDSWVSLSSWCRDDVGDAIAFAIVHQAIGLSANTDEATDAAAESDFDNIRRVVSQIDSPAPGSDLGKLKAGIATGTDTFESAIALECSRAFTFEKAELAGLLRDVRAAEMASTSAPLHSVQLGVADLTIRMTAEAPTFGIWKSDPKHSSASVGADVIAAWIDAEQWPASEGCRVLEAMVTTGTETHAKLATSIVNAWLRDPAGTDSKSVPLVGSARIVARLGARMEEGARNALRDVWVGALGVDTAMEHVAILAADLTNAGLPEGWADEALGQILPKFQRSVEFSAAPTEAAALILATGSVGQARERELLESLTRLIASGGTNRTRGFTSLAALPWSKSVVPEMANSLSPFVAEVPEKDFWALHDLMSSKSVTNPAFTTRVIDEFAGSGATEAMKERADVLATELPLSESAAIAIAAGSESALAAVAGRHGELSEGDSSTWVSILRQVAGSSADDRARSGFADILAGSNPELYLGAVKALLADTLDTGSGDSSVWAFVTGPLDQGGRAAVWASVGDALVAGAREARAASLVLRAASGDSEFDKMVASGLEATLQHWITENPDPQLAELIVAALRTAPHSRSSLESFLKRRKPSNQERKAAFEAARRAIS